jgi:hypothetical protein
MNDKSEFTRQVTERAPEGIRDVVERKLAVFEQIRALKAENRDLRDQIMSSGQLNSTALAVAVMCW